MRAPTLLVLAAACGYPQPTDVPGDGGGSGNVDGSVDGPPGPVRSEVALIPVYENPDVDVLFVVDDSPGSVEPQGKLRAAFPAFLSVLEGHPLGMPNMHFGIVTSDLGSKGADDAAAGPGIGSGPGACSANGKSGNLTTNGSSLVTGVFISDVRAGGGGRVTNYTGTLNDAFTAVSSVGNAGCGFEQHVEAAKRAVNNNPSNAGFVRVAANLVVLVIAEEDDCSMAHSTLISSDTNTYGPLQSFRCTRFGITCDVGGATSDDMNIVGAKSGCRSNESGTYLTDLGRYTTFFGGLKTDRRTVMMGSITAPVQPVAVELRTPPGGGSVIPALAHSCASSSAMTPGDPAIRLATMVNQTSRGTNHDVCSDTFDKAMATFARQIRTMTGDTCLVGDIALPENCVVIDQTQTGEAPVPACAAPGGVDCFEIIKDATRCAAGQQLRVSVNRSSDPPAGTMMTVRCVR